MAQLSPYLTFDGNCREAMTFYQDCLGGVLMLQRLADTPLGDRLPEQMREYILHAELDTAGLILMASDIPPETQVIRNASSMILTFDQEEEGRNAYSRLAKNSRSVNALKLTHWGELFGGLTDRYGNQWLFSVQHSTDKYSNEAFACNATR